MNKILDNYKIFIDITSLTHKSAKSFFVNYFSHLLEKSSNKVIIPYKLIEELKILEYNSDDKLRKKGNNGLTILKYYQTKNLIQIAGNKNDPKLTELFITIFTKFSKKHNLCFISQNKKLIYDVYKSREKLLQNSIKAFKPYRIIGKNNIEELKYVDLKKTSVNYSNYKKLKKFNIYKQPINYKEAHKLNIHYVPKKGEYIYTDNKDTLLLVKEIGGGGEGTVYLTETGLVCKIYKKEKLTNLKKEKIKLMLSNKIEYDGICWPISIAYNKNGEFVGYLMKKASGKEIQKCLFIKMLLYKHFPNWTRKNLINVCINILDKIKFLHKYNIVIGDINPLNILIKSDTEIYFVDTDSFQVENYPCSVGTVHYTPPELQRKDYKTFLRTFENEYFAIATLIFMILLPGKPPFSKIGGSDPATNIKNKDFSYPYGKERKKKLLMVHGDLYGVIFPVILKRLSLMFLDITKEKVRMIGLNY